MAPGKGLTFESGKLTASGKIGNKIIGLRKGHKKVLLLIPPIGT